ncbi:MAG TPA: hypothetical protein VGX78_19970, partial [Pirellulales bacterium]|nr:hypothetical protein [Pirellulales bacterium]
MSPRSAPHHDYNYHHDVLDYWPGSPAGGCSSCGGSQGLGGRELMNVFVERVHRYRDMTQEACAFGPGVFCNYDVSLVFNPIQAQQQQGQPPPAVFYSVELFDPLEVEPKFYTEGYTNTGNPPMPTPTGIYTDTNSLSIKNLQCYDANGNFVVDPLTASSAVITNWPGYKSTFDIINLGGYAPSPTGWWRFEETSGTSAADASGNGNTGTLVNTPTRIVGKIGNALQFNSTNQSVSLGNPSDLNFQGNITIAAWVKLSSSTGNQALISHGNYNPINHTTPSVFLQLTAGNMVAGCADSSNVVHS